MSSSLIGLANAAAAQTKEEDKVEKPEFPLRTASMPILKRDSSAVLGVSQQHVQAKTDWRLFLTVEERKLIRSKISCAYEGKVKTYDELLQMCSAIEEELVFISAPSRLDYFKTGLQYEKRVMEKKKQLSGSTAITNVPPEASASPAVKSSCPSPGTQPPTETEERAAKRIKTSE